MFLAHVQQLREAEGHDFRHAQLAAAVEDDIEVDVHDAAAPRLQQHVVQVPVAQAQQVAHLPPHSNRSSSSGTQVCRHVVSWQHRPGRYTAVTESGLLNCR